MLVPTRADQAPRDVVAQALAVLPAVAGCQTVSGLVKELARKQRPRRLGLCAARLGRIFLEQPLNPVPEHGIDDRRVLPGVGLLLVADAAGVNWVAQDVMEVAALEGQAAGKTARAPITLAGAQAKRLRPVFDKAHTPTKY